jgi:hypothetical protein
VQIRQTILDLELPKKVKTVSAPRPACTWHGPPEGTAGSGGVARDDTGFRDAWGRVYQGISDPLCAEALAFQDGVSFAQNRNFVLVTFETDRSELVRHWEARGTDRSTIAPLLQDVSELAASFQSFSLVFTCRSANTVAHLCARAASLGGVSQ